MEHLEHSQQSKVPTSATKSQRTGDTVRDDLICVAVNGALDGRKLLVDLTVDVSLNVPTRGICSHGRSIGDVVLHQVSRRGDVGGCHVPGHHENIWLRRMSEREMPVCIENAGSFRLASATIGVFKVVAAYPWW